MFEQKRGKMMGSLHENENDFDVKKQCKMEEVKTTETRSGHNLGNAKTKISCKKKRQTQRGTIYCLRLIIHKEKKKMEEKIYF